jgi:hypothetical protein
MDWALERDAQGWSWHITGECEMDDLGRMQEDALRVLAEPANTVVHWTDTEWIHIAFLQILMSLRKGVCKSGFGLTLTADGIGFQNILREFGVAAAIGDTTPVGATA